jgi:hypothetical protein
MSEILFKYEQVAPTTWAYLSSLLTIALYFKFSRFWSVRNLDLVTLLLLAPGLLLVQFGMDQLRDEQARVVEHIGYIWLFAVNGCLLLRLLLDAAMVRRPLLEPNLSVGGLTFLGISLFVFLMGNVLTGRPNESDITSSQRADQLQNLEASGEEELNTLKTHGPGFPLIYLLPHISTQSLMGREGEALQRVPGTDLFSVNKAQVVTAQVMAILSQLMIVLGMMLIGLRHFDNIRAGIAAATLYLLLPYTAMWTGAVTHALPAALLVWAVLLYRRPFFSGALLGLAFGTIYYPLYLLPLWLSFYWQKGVWRFVLGFAATVAVLVVTLAFTSSGLPMFLDSLKQMFGVQFPVDENLRGAWQFWNTVYRYPIIAAFIALSFSFVIWPPQKNLATLMSCSAALMLGTQFWHAHSGGGVALAWYLPLLLLTVFRPNLEDRVASAMVK